MKEEQEEQDQPDDDPVSNPEFLKDYSDFPIGNIVSASKLSSMSENNVRFREILLNEYNSITAENDMKMAEIYRGPEDFNFTKGDAIVAYAKENGLRVHGHALVWHSSLPGWLNSFSGSDEEFSALIENYIKTTVSHFAEAKDENGKAIVASWDVMNEYFNAGGVRSSLFLDKLGDNYIGKLFQWAREADSDVKLFYNDYNITGDPGKRNQVLNMVADLQSNNIDINGIGLQMHLNHDWPTGDVEQCIRDITNTGLLVHVSELDVKVNYNNDVSSFTAERATFQARQYQRVSYYYSAIVPADQQFGITIWGFRDQDSWLYQNGSDWPLLYDSNFNPKPAYDGFLKGLEGEAP